MTCRLCPPTALRQFTSIFNSLAVSLTVGGALALAGPAEAGVIIQPVSAMTDMGSFSAQYLPLYAIDQSALASNYVSGVTDFDAFAPNTNTVSGGGSFNTWYSSQGVLTGNFDFFLGSVQTIESFALWADPQNIGQGVNAFNLYADDNPAFTSPVLLGNYNAVNGLGNASNFGQVFTFAPTDASYVRMEIVSNHGSTFVTGFVEAAFERIIPGPGAMAALALGGLAVLRRRRRN